MRSLNFKSTKGPKKTQGAWLMMQLSGERGFSNMQKALSSISSTTQNQAGWHKPIVPPAGR